MDELQELYSELLLEYSRDVQYKRELEDFDREQELINPLCGDQIKVQVKFTEDGKIKDIAYQGRGCAISQAAAGIVCCLLQGKDQQTFETLHKYFIRLISGEDLAPEELEQLDDAKILSGIARLPARHRCAFLAWENVKDLFEAQA